MVHAADVPPHIIILRHCDLHGVGMAVTIPLPALEVAQGWGTGLGQEGLLIHNTPGFLPWEPSAASGALKAGPGVLKESGHPRTGHSGPPGLSMGSSRDWSGFPRTGHRGPQGLEWLSRGLGLVVPKKLGLGSLRICQGAGILEGQA